MELSFVDVEVGSKVLISTRMKGLLVGAHQVDVGLPSASDSARMLLAADGSGADSEQSAPKGVSEIVDLCGRLPLALGMAGRLAASPGLVGSQDWSGMTGVLKAQAPVRPVHLCLGQKFLIIRETPSRVWNQRHQRRLRRPSNGLEMFLRT